jgi:group I intron endonuclease
MWVHKKTKIVYVGQTKDLHARPFRHRRVHTNSNLNELFQKYGKESFIIVILECYGNNEIFTSSPETYKQMLKDEMFYIESIPKEYRCNIRDSNNNTWAGFSQEKKDEILKKHFLGERNPFYGKKHSEKTIAFFKSRKGETHPWWGA